MKKWLKITDNDGATVVLKVDNIDFLRVMDSQIVRVLTNGGNMFEVNKEQLKDIMDGLEL